VDACEAVLGDFGGEGASVVARGQDAPGLKERKPRVAVGHDGTDERVRRQANSAQKDLDDRVAVAGEERRRAGRGRIGPGSAHARGPPQDVVPVEAPSATDAASRQPAGEESVIASVVVGFPLFVAVVRSAFEAVDRRHDEVAWTLGLSPWKTFLRVTLPLAGAGILAGSVLAFARARRVRRYGDLGSVAVIAAGAIGTIWSAPVVGQR
jgi:hypothetical protein